MLKFLKKNTQILLWIFLFIDLTTKAHAIEGVEYQIHVTAKQQVIHALKIKPQLVIISAVRSKDLGTSRETVANIAKYYKAVAAINGGFFRINENGNGLPAGVLQINKKLYGIAYKPRGAIGWHSDVSTILIDRINTKTTIKIDDFYIPIYAMDQPVNAKRAILYTDNYGYNLESNLSGTYIAIDNNKIINIQKNSPIIIPPEGYVCFIGSQIRQELPTFRINEQVLINSNIIPKFDLEKTDLWNKLTFIVGGSPLLLKNQEKITDYSEENIREDFILEQTARTAVGILQTGSIVFVVVEKNKLLGRPGMNLEELADFMLQIGCSDALNLDGGGSSAMYFDNRIVNHTDAQEKITDAILVLPKSNA